MPPPATAAAAATGPTPSAGYVNPWPPSAGRDAGYASGYPPLQVPYIPRRAAPMQLPNRGGIGKRLAIGAGVLITAAGVFTVVYKLRGGSATDAAPASAVATIAAPDGGNAALVDPGTEPPAATGTGGSAPGALAGLGAVGAERVSATPAVAGSAAAGTPDSVAPTVAPMVAPTPIKVAKASPPDKGRSSDPRGAEPRRGGKSAAPERRMLAFEKTASGLYKDRKFDRAAETLRANLARAGDDEDRMLALARDYTNVGLMITKGDSSGAGSPSVAMTAYLAALAADRRAGGAHAVYLREKLAAIAPLAAMALWNDGKWESARKAADVALNYGNGANAVVVKVRSNLEKKAKELYEKGTRVAKNDPAAARQHWDNVLAIVPSDSVWYGKAYSAKNSRSRSSRDDEDE